MNVTPEYAVNNQLYVAISKRRMHISRDIEDKFISLMYGTILMFIKFNNFGTWRSNSLKHLFHSFCCTTQHIFELLRVYELNFNKDKYGTWLS